MKKILVFILTIFGMTAFAQNSLEDIKFKDLNNKTVTLSSYKDKKVYVKLWASWCPVCLAGLPEIDELSREKNDFHVITIVSPGNKGEKSTKKFIEWYKGLEYKNVTVLLDESGEVIKRVKLRGYPTNVILNEKLEITKVLPGHLNKELIKKVVK